jgi:hypothetical protein
VLKRLEGRWRGAAVGCIVAGLGTDVPDHRLRMTRGKRKLSASWPSAIEAIDGTALAILSA